MIDDKIIDDKIITIGDVGGQWDNFCEKIAEAGFKFYKMGEDGHLVIIDPRCVFHATGRKELSEAAFNSMYEAQKDRIMEMTSGALRMRYFSETGGYPTSEELGAAIEKIKTMKAIEQVEKRFGKVSLHTEGANHER